MEDSSSEKWIEGQGFMLLHVQIDKVFCAEKTPQGVVVENTFYGMRMFNKSGKFGEGSAMLFSLVFTSLKKHKGIIIVSPHFVFLCFMFAIPLLAVSICVGIWATCDIIAFIGFVIPTLLMIIMWQFYFQRFIFANVYNGQKQYDLICRQFIAALRNPCSLFIISMKRIGWFRALVELARLFAVGLVRSIKSSK